MVDIGRRSLAEAEARRQARQRKQEEIRLRTGGRRVDGRVVGGTTVIPLEAKGVRVPRFGTTPGVFDIRQKRFLSSRAVTERRARQLTRKAGGDLRNLSIKERQEFNALQKTLGAARTRTERLQTVRGGEPVVLRGPDVEQRNRLQQLISSVQSDTSNIQARIDALNKTQKELEATNFRDVNKSGKFVVDVKNLQSDLANLQQENQEVESARQDFNRTQQVKVARTTTTAEINAALAAIPKTPSQLRTSGIIQELEKTRQPPPTPLTTLSLGMPPPIIPPFIQQTAAGFVEGVGTAGESFFNIFSRTGEEIEKALPKRVRTTATKILFGTEKDPTIFRGVFSEVVSGRISKEEARRRLVGFGRPTAQIGGSLAAFFVGGPAGIATLATFGAASGKPEDFLLGAAFGGATGLFKTGTTFLRLVGGRTGQVARFGEQFVGKALIPGIFGVSLLATGAELRGAAEQPQEIKRISQQVAGGFGAFGLGAFGGSFFGRQFLGPAEATLTRELFIRRQIRRKKLTTEDVKEFRQFFEIGKEFETLRGKPRELDLKTQRLTARESKTIERFLRRDPDAALFGSAAIRPQVPRSIARKLKKPEDIDISSTNPRADAQQIIKLLEAGGTKRLSTPKRKPGEGVIITKAGVKVIEVKPRSRLEASFETVRGVTEVTPFVTTPSGIKLFKLSAQAKRQAIGGALEQPNLRQKDIERLETLSRVFTPKQLEAARQRGLKPPKVVRAAEEFRGFLGEQRGELFPGTSRFLSPFSQEILGIRAEARKPTRRRLARGEISFLPEPPQTNIFPSRLPAPRQPSRLPPFQRGFFPSLLPTDRRERFAPSRVPRETRTQDIISRLFVGDRPSRLPPLRVPRDVPSRLPTLQTPPGFPPLVTTSTLPPSVPSRQPPPFVQPPITPPPRVPSRLPPPTRRPPRVPPTTFPQFGFGLRGFGRRQELVEGFNVFVKTKPFKRKIFRKVNTKTLPRQNALARGSHVADATISQTFKIVKSKKRARQRPPPFFSALGKFNFKPKKNVYIEKRGHAIDTVGEVQGLKVGKFLARERRASQSLFGLVQQQRQRKRKRRATTTARRPTRRGFGGFRIEF